METIKKLNEICEKDHTYQWWSKSENDRSKVNYAEFYDKIAHIKFDDTLNVPDRIRSHFATVLNLLLYSWYYYPFAIIAKSQAFVCLEYALYLKKESQEPLKKQNKKSGIELEELLLKVKDWNPAIYCKIKKELKEFLKPKKETLAGLLQKFQKIGQINLEDIITPQTSQYNQNIQTTLPEETLREIMLERTIDLPEDNYLTEESIINYIQQAELIYIPDKLLPIDINNKIKAICDERNRLAHEINMENKNGLLEVEWIKMIAKLINQLFSDKKE